MENEHVLSGLVRKRAEVAARLAVAQLEAEHLAKALECVEATILLFSPDAVAPVAQPPRKPRQPAGFHGEFSRPMLDVLREAVAPLSTRQVALGVMAARGYDTSDSGTIRAVHRKVNASLREARERGILRSEQRDDGQTWWWVAQ